ncbi:type-4 ice-structuring protein LS-12-like [Hippocampus comes]|uniref:type-4 ice-structuring protein LS-12-like n=1 Tax=Hippocampus comes TaxID=109280 RepID=UPI00094F0732|nr:PREDICTED: type-4 ice-structuring protein LS-12-like [Hippocampus comes]
MQTYTPLDFGSLWPTGTQSNKGHNNVLSAPQSIQWHLDVHHLVQSQSGARSAAPPPDRGAIRRVPSRQVATINRSRSSCATDLTQSATMKVIIAAFVVIALAQGSLAVDATEMEMIGQKFEEIKNKMTEELSKMINTQELGSQAQAFLEQQRNQFEPMMTKVQEQMKAAAASMQEQLEPMTTNFQAQMQPMVLKFQEQMEAILRQLTEQAKAMTN